MIAILKKNASITLDELAAETGLSKSGVRYVIKKLRNVEIVDREGGRKHGKWIVRT